MQQSRKSPELLRKFCTGSSYSGLLDDEGRMTGFGTYRYPNGTEYRGHFKNGVFHGRGMLVHPSKFKMCGSFVNGKCINHQVFFGDGLEYDENNWKYCSDSDRRFWSEIVQGISPVGETFLTNEKPSRKIPRGLYDAVEGFFDPHSEYILDAKTLQRLRYVCPEEKKWIIRNCRMNSSDFEEREELEANEKTNNYSTSTDSNVSSDTEDKLF